MSMRKLIAFAGKNTPALQAKIARRFYLAGALGKGKGDAAIPANPTKPFVVVREIDVLPANVAKDTSPNVCRRVYQVYVHDERGTYSRIDQILAILRETVRGLRDQVSSTGSRCIDATWDTVSADTEDLTYDSNMKYATFSLVSSE